MSTYSSNPSDPTDTRSRGEGGTRPTVSGGATLADPIGNYGLPTDQQAYLDRATEATGQGATMNFHTGEMGEGQLGGLSSAENLYGMTSPELGVATQDILSRKRARLDQSSPASTRARESRNRQIRMARAGGRTSAQQEDIKRKAESDIGNMEYAREGAALTDYQKMISKIMTGTTQLELGHMGLAVGSEVSQVPQTGGSGTVICTELYKQGYMDEGTYELDKVYGAHLRKTRPHVYGGYLFLASPVVKLMKRSILFTKIISIPALCWADYMAGRYNIVGHIISKVGEFTCGIVGKLTGVRYERT
jgi:hypothetical protein